ncbi:MAG: 2-isopropylmalate synthase [Alphaproteobacteria bacterium]|nr:2-isopropylmalate synthase [Alphaproteobacteria bacterium]
MTDRIWIYDSTLFAGDHAPGHSMRAEDKPRLAEMLDRMGVDIIEAGMPDDENGIESIRRVAQVLQGAKIAIICRTRPEDIMAAVQLSRRLPRVRLNVFTAVSPQHMKHRLQMDAQETLSVIHHGVTAARTHAEDVQWTAEDATRAEADFLCRAVETAIRAGAATINIADSVGYGVPAEIAQIVQMLKNRVPDIDRAVLSVDCPNDLGLALANSLAALDAGARQVTVTLGGIGARAGHAALEEVVMAIRTRQDRLAFETAVISEQLVPAARLLGELTGFAVQPSKPVIGLNVFSQESGIHLDGRAYDVMTPESVGRDKTDLVLGKYSGRSFFRAKLRSLGFELDNAALDAAYARFQDYAERRRKVSDDDLRVIVTATEGLPRERITFIGMGVKSGSFGPQEAELEIEMDGIRTRARAVGKGPVDACFKAMRILVPHDDVVLTHYELKALTHGSDAKGEVNVRLAGNGHSYNGIGIDPDVIVSSVRAYIDALNRLLAGRDAQNAHPNA